MIREIIVTSPAGVRLCFEASGEKGLALQRYTPEARTMDILNMDKPEFMAPGTIVGVVPTSWLVELNDTAT